MLYYPILSFVHLYFCDFYPSHKNLSLFSILKRALQATWNIRNLGYSLLCRISNFETFTKFSLNFWEFFAKWLFKYPNYFYIEEVIATKQNMYKTKAPTKSEDLQEQSIFLNPKKLKGTFRNTFLGVSHYFIKSLSFLLFGIRMLRLNN